MDDDAAPPSVLFTLRLWRVQTDDGRDEWRGKLQHVASRESRYFRSWAALVAGLLTLLSEHSRRRPGTGADDREEDAMT